MSSAFWPRLCVTERGKQTSPVYRSTTKDLETPSLAPSWLKTQRANGDTHQHAPQIQQQTVLMPHQPTKVIRMVLILEPSLIEWISVTIGSQHNHGLKDQTHLGIIVGGSAHKVRGIVEASTIRGCNHNEDCCSPFSVVAALVPLAHKMVKRRRHLIHDIS